MHMLVVPDSAHGLQSLWSLILCHVAFWGPTMCPTVFTSSPHAHTPHHTHATHTHTHAHTRTHTRTHTRATRSHTVMRS
jgi:hypothetical protein